MKKVLIAFLVILLLADVALLVYGGIFLGEENSYGFVDKPLIEPVNPRAYARAVAEWIEANKDDNISLWGPTNPSKDPAKFAAEVDGWFDVFGEADPSTAIPARYSGADLVTNLLIPITYNHNRTPQYCLNYHYEVRSAGGNTVTDGMRLKVQREPAVTDRYYFSCVWSGTSGVRASPVTLTIEYMTEKLYHNAPTSYVNKYNAKTRSYDYNLAYGYKEKRPDRDIEREVPYKLYGLLCIPLYVGSGKEKSQDAYATIDSSVIDGSTVFLTEPTEENRYYVLSFSEDLEKAQMSANIDCLNNAFADQMKNVKIKQADFVVEIWESGLFRQATVNFVINANINGKQGDATISMNYRFYFDDESCDITAYIAHEGWEKHLYKNTRAIFDEERRKKAEKAKE